MTGELTLNFEIDIEEIMKTIAKTEHKEVHDVSVDNVSEYIDDILRDNISSFSRKGIKTASDGWMLSSLSDELIEEIYDVQDRYYDEKEKNKSHKEER